MVRQKETVHKKDVTRRGGRTAGDNGGRGNGGRGNGGGRGRGPGGRGRGQGPRLPLAWGPRLPLGRKEKQHGNPPAQDMVEMDSKLRACLRVSIMVGPPEQEENPVEHWEIIEECMALPAAIANYDHLEVQLPCTWDMIQSLEKDKLRQEWNWDVPTFKLNDTKDGNFMNSAIQKNENKMWNAQKKAHDDARGYTRSGRRVCSLIADCKQWNLPWSHGANIKKMTWILNPHLNKEAANDLACGKIEENIKVPSDVPKFVKSHIKHHRKMQAHEKLRLLGSRGVDQDGWFSGEEAGVDQMICDLFGNLGAPSIPKTPRF